MPPKKLGHGQQMEAARELQNMYKRGNPQARSSSSRQAVRVGNRFAGNGATNGFRPQARQPIPFKFDPNAAVEAQVKPSTIAWLSYRDDPPKSSAPVPSPANAKSIGNTQENVKPGDGPENVQAQASVNSRKPQLATEQKQTVVNDGKVLCPPPISLSVVSGNNVVGTKRAKECGGEIDISGKGEGELKLEKEKDTGTEMVEEQGEEDEEQEKMSTSIIIEEDPDDPTKYHIPLMEQFKLLQLGWTPPPSNSVGSPLLGNFGVQQLDKKQMTFLDLEAGMAIQHRALVQPRSLSPSPTPKFRKLIDIDEQTSEDEDEDLIEFPSDDEKGKTKQDMKPSDELRSLANPADFCKCKYVSRTVQGLASSKWARPGYQHLGHFPKNTAILGHEEGCPVRVEFAKAHPLDCGANPATYHGQDAGVIYLRTAEDDGTGPQPPLKAFNAEAPDFVPQQK